MKRFFYIWFILTGCQKSLEVKKCYWEYENRSNFLMKILYLSTVPFLSLYTTIDLLTPFARRFFGVVLKDEWRVPFQVKYINLLYPVKSPLRFKFRSTKYHLMPSAQGILRFKLLRSHTYSANKFVFMRRIFPVYICIRWASVWSMLLYLWYSW